MRHEKLGWEEISLQAAKIVSFIGMLVAGRKYNMSSSIAYRLGWT